MEQKYYLHFLPDGRVMVVNFEQPWTGDYYIDDTNAIRKSIRSDEEYWSERKEYMKLIAGISELPSILTSLSDIKKLIRNSEIENEAKLKYEYLTVKEEIAFERGAKWMAEQGKEFTLDDLKKAMSHAYGLYKSVSSFETISSEYLQSINIPSSPVEVQIKITDSGVVIERIIV